uniref:Uncharacterized protein n=1 Tax=Vespula pensylvanica TaxID=30213 RepID=A0A834K7X8_VESPE|nr:hypothetical protein H0235_015741 [Vespula pensylvanica]
MGFQEQPSGLELFQEASSFETDFAACPVACFSFYTEPSIDFVGNGWKTWTLLDTTLKGLVGENQGINSKRLDSCQESSEKYFAGRLSLRSLTFRREIFGGSESRGERTREVERKGRPTLRYLFLSYFLMTILTSHSSFFYDEEDPTLVRWIIELAEGNTQPFLSEKAKLTKQATAFRTVLYLDSSKRRLKGEKE